MNQPNAPKDGDFASYVQSRQAGHGESAAPPTPRPQTVEDVLMHGEEPTEELLADLEALHNAPDVPEDELARQALEALGDDGDPSTPE